MSYFFIIVDPHHAMFCFCLFLFLTVHASERWKQHALHNTPIVQWWVKERLPWKQRVFTGPLIIRYVVLSSQYNKHIHRTCTDHTSHIVRCGSPSTMATGVVWLSFCMLVCYIVCMYVCLHFPLWFPHRSHQRPASKVHWEYIKRWQWSQGSALHAYINSIYTK